MQQLLCSGLYCPFASQINKHIDILEKHALEWVIQFNLLANESSYKRFCKSKFFFLAASAYPNCELEELKIANDWLSWVFIWDDQCDLSNLGKEPDVLKDFHQRFIDILNGADLTSKDIPLAYALRDLRERILQRGSKEWFDYFVNRYQGYFDGCVEEAINRAQGITPDVESYMLIRRLSLGGYLCLALMEFCDQIMIPEFFRYHHVMKELKVMTINILAWCNDIFSVHREMSSGDVHNLVLLIDRPQIFSLEKATIAATEMHNQEVDRLQEFELSIPSFGEKLDTELEKYIFGIHSWISANFNWYYHSGRYETIERLELSQENLMLSL
ncbi:MAG: terpene synthase [Nostoc sp. ChiSLP02]|nr:terpene synthase [Nostoc sp. DedSLP05]MDZ8097343.1 terpene synthase [Nostoc sp. DedSLP01]MDZ8188730.1 terpene synthase [Nostoc sp. ChiSLP02]